MRLPSKVEGKASFVIAILAILVVAWSRTKEWSSSCKAVGRADGSRCKHSLTKLFASLERWSGISGTSLLFPILKIAATCHIQHDKMVWSTNISHLTLTKITTIKYGPNIHYLTPSYWLQGGFDVAISRIVHPKLQISTARL